VAALPPVLFLYGSEMIRKLRQTARSLHPSLSITHEYALSLPEICDLQLDSLRRADDGWQCWREVGIVAVGGLVVANPFVKVGLQAG
jgi:hypothetical protein